MKKRTFFLGILDAYNGKGKAGFSDTFFQSGSAISMITGVFNVLSFVFTTISVSISTAITLALAGIRRAILRALTSVTKFVENIVSETRTYKLFKRISKIGINVAKKTKGFFNDLGKALSEKAKELKKWSKEKFKEFTDGVKEKYNNAKEWTKEKIKNYNERQRIARKEYIKDANDRLYEFQNKVKKPSITKEEITDFYNDYKKKSEEAKIAYKKRLIADGENFDFIIKGDNIPSASSFSTDYYAKLEDSVNPKSNKFWNDITDADKAMIDNIKFKSISNEFSGLNNFIDKTAGIAKQLRDELAVAKKTRKAGLISSVEEMFPKAMTDFKTDFKGMKMSAKQVSEMIKGFKIIMKLVDQYLKVMDAYEGYKAKVKESQSDEEKIKLYIDQYIVTSETFAVYTAVVGWFSGFIARWWALELSVGATSAEIGARDIKIGLVAFAIGTVIITIDSFLPEKYRQYPKLRKLIEKINESIDAKVHNAGKSYLDYLGELAPELHTDPSYVREPDWLDNMNTNFNEYLKEHNGFSEYLKEQGESLKNNLSLRGLRKVLGVDENISGFSGEWIDKSTAFESNDLKTYKFLKPDDLFESIKLDITFNDEYGNSTTIFNTNDLFSFPTKDEDLYLLHPKQLMCDAFTNPTYNHTSYVTTKLTPQYNEYNGKLDKLIRTIKENKRKEAERKAKEEKARKKAAEDAAKAMNSANSRSSITETNNTTGTVIETGQCSINNKDESSRWSQLVNNPFGSSAPKQSFQDMATKPFGV